MSTVKLYTESNGGSWGNGVDAQNITISFTVPSETYQAEPVLAGFDMYFPGTNHNFNRSMFMLSATDPGSPWKGGTKTITVTCTVMLRDKNGKDSFDANVIVTLICVMD